MSDANELGDGAPAPEGHPEALVIENDPAHDLRRLGEWLAAEGLRARVLRPHTGDRLPDDPTGYAALIVLGGSWPFYEGKAEVYGLPWRSACESLLRAAVSHRVPTLAVGLGAQLLATAHAGAVEPAAEGPELGPALVARRDAADRDPLFADVPFTPDVLQWHFDEITELPVGSVLLAASPHYPHQAFRIGPSAWGLQFHIEPDEAMVAGWLADDLDLLHQLGYDSAALRSAAARVMDDLADVWQPFAARFAALVQGGLEPAPAELPVLGR